MSKSSEDHAYDEGYLHEKKGNIAGDLLDSFGNTIESIVPIPDNPSSEAKAYEGGRIDGSKDRNDDNNSHYQGGRYNEKKLGKNNKRMTGGSKSTSYFPLSEVESGHTSPRKRLSDEATIILGMLGLAVIVGVVWFIFKVAIPITILNIAFITFIASFIKKDWQRGLLGLSFLGAAYILADYDNGWLTQSLVHDVSFSYSTVKLFIYVNFIAGLISSYLIFIGVFEDEGILQRLVIIAAFVFLGGIIVFGDHFFNAPLDYTTKQVIPTTT